MQTWSSVLPLQSLLSLVYGLHHTMWHTSVHSYQLDVLTIYPSIYLLIASCKKKQKCEYSLVSLFLLTCTCVVCLYPVEPTTARETTSANSLDLVRDNVNPYQILRALVRHWWDCYQINVRIGVRGDKKWAGPEANRAKKKERKRKYVVYKRATSP